MPQVTLNPQQLEAVQHERGPLLVLAGAGTGKTRVLTHRIAHLVQNGVTPGRILAVTFTNKAAGEMKKRIEQLVGPCARDLWMGTFHSVCVKILRRHALEIGIAPSFTIYDAADQLGVVKEVLKNLNLDDKKLPPGSLVSRLSRLKDQLITAEALHTEADNPFTKTLANIYENYEKILAQNNALDFGDLIARVVSLFKTHPAILNGYQNLWQHVLVDEYQDTNHAQYTLVSLLAAKHHNLCVVGDPDQSIYRWRGADLNNILNFEKDYPQARVIRLEQNYRSVQNILKAAGAVIANNERRKEKGLWSATAAGEKITAASLNNEKEEAAYVVEQLRQLHVTQKIPYTEMACFYRTNAQSRPLEEVLRMAGIPYIIYGGIRFYERAEIKDALAYLRLLVQPQDAIALKRIINVPARGIGKTTLEKIESVALQRNIPFYKAARQVEHPKLQTFLQWVEQKRLLFHSDECSGVEMLRDILESSGYLHFLTTQGSIEAQERLANINELVASLADFETIPAFLEHVALISDLDQAGENGVLPLMTLHLAKGLEFRGVGIVGLEEGLLPHARSLDEVEELEEERRLFYVGMTRAKERLFITHAWRRFMNGQEQYSLPSRFLEEMPAELVERHETSHRWGQEDDFDQSVDKKWMGDRRDEAEGPLLGRRSRRGWQDPSISCQTAYRIGSKVRHPDFGIGTIAAAEKTSLGEKVTVRFASGMIKKLIAEYARLERV